MHLKAELTFYPLSEEPISKVKRVLEHLAQFENLAIQTFPTATIIDGEMNEVMSCLQSTMRWSHEEFGLCVFIAKFLPAYQ